MRVHYLYYQNINRYLAKQDDAIKMEIYVMEAVEMNRTSSMSKSVLRYDVDPTLVF